MESAARTIRTDSRRRRRRSRREQHSLSGSAANRFTPDAPNRTAINSPRSVKLVMIPAANHPARERHGLSGLPRPKYASVTGSNGENAGRQKGENASRDCYEKEISGHLLRAGTLQLYRQDLLSRREALLVAACLIPDDQSELGCSGGERACPPNRDREIRSTRICLRLHFELGVVSDLRLWRSYRYREKIFCSVRARS